VAKGGTSITCVGSENKGENASSYVSTADWYSGNAGCIYKIVFKHTFEFARNKGNAQGQNQERAAPRRGIDKCWAFMFLWE
jgi:hypothetical protein